MKSLTCPNKHRPPSGKGDVGGHHSPRLLHDEVGKESPLPVPELREDILLDNRDTFSTSAPAYGL
jgi:hypothetical protein